jgi:hypothetical protein
MLQDRIDVIIVAEKLARVHEAFTTIETELDFLVSVEPAVAKRLLRLGLRNETFTRGMLEAGAQNPTEIPQSVNLAALNRDLIARDQLLPVQKRAQKLYERLTHTNLLLGADLYSGALAIYKSLKAFGRAAGLGLLLEEFGRRFSKKKTVRPSENESE